MSEGMKAMNELRCDACGEVLEQRPGESFMANTDGRAWHMGCYRAARTPSPSSSPEVGATVSVLVRQTERFKADAPLNDIDFALTTVGDLRALLDVLHQMQRREEAMRWQPIETAPKASAAVLGCYLTAKSSVTRVMFWDDEDERWVTAGGGLPHEATHWMPLPGPPAVLGDGGGK